MGMACSNDQAAGKRKDLSQEKCTRLVEDYVTKTRGWLKRDYRILSAQEEMGGQGFSVEYIPETTPPLDNHGKSFHLELDKDCNKLVAELGYQ